MRNLGDITVDAVRLAAVPPSLYKAEALSELVIEALEFDVQGGDYQALYLGTEKKMFVVKRIAKELDTLVKFLHEREDT